MPSNCDNTSAGVTYPAKFSGELIPCAGSIQGGGYDATACPWFRTPPKPSAQSSDGMGLPVAASGAPRLSLPSGDCRLAGSTLSCDGLLDRP
jgi:hypothetical protein